MNCIQWLYVDVLLSIVLSIALFTLHRCKSLTSVSNQLSHGTVHLMHLSSFHINLVFFSYCTNPKNTQNYDYGWAWAGMVCKLCHQFCTITSLSVKIFKKKKITNFTLFRFHFPITKKQQSSLLMSFHFFCVFFVFCQTKNPFN